MKRHWIRYRYNEDSGGWEIFDPMWGWMPGYSTAAAACYTIRTLRRSLPRLVRYADSWAEPTCDTLLELRTNVRASHQRLTPTGDREP
jgi:hypothetical protein